MKRFWPRSLMGQMLLAVALALLLVQGLGAFLLYREQSERREAGLLHGAAFRLISETQDVEPGERFGRAPPFRGRGRGFPVEQSPSSPLQAGDARHSAAEAELRRILHEQGVRPANVIVTYRTLTEDSFALAQATRRAERFDRGDPDPDRRIMIAGVQLSPDSEWLVARTGGRRGKMELASPLLIQTLVIYLVLVGAVALILRRITRPIAALTQRVERFAANRDTDGQIAPQGPDDIRRLIDAHNAMEARIAALLDEKDIMLGAIGHDLKTPLAALRVRIETVEDETERARMAGTIEDIVRSLDDILSLARVGRPSDPLERTELSALVASVVEEYEDMSEPVDLGETERIVLSLRPTWLRRGLRNLIGNSLRYGERARVSLSREDGRALIQIEDDGPGIPETEIEQMMEPFTRGEPSRNTRTGGAGLGLALARAIAEQHGGSLTLANRRNMDGAIAGLSARLELPLT